MKNKKAFTLSFLFLISLQFLIGLTYFNSNAEKGRNVDILDPEISDIIIGNYTFPGAPGSVALNESIRIGLLDDMKRQSGENVWNGALLAAKEINLAGGITINSTQYYVGLAAEDTDEANPFLDTSKGAAAANRMITYNDPHFIIGGYRTEAVLAYQEVLMDAKIPFLCTGAAPDLLCQNVLDDYNRYKYFFRVMLNSTAIAIDLITYVINLALQIGSMYGGTINKVAILRENFAWTSDLSAVLTSELSSWGISVVQNIAFPIDATPVDFATSWSMIESAEAQITIPLISEGAGVTLAQSYRYNQPRCLLAGLNVIAQSLTYWDDTEGACQYEIHMGLHRTNKTIYTIPFWDSFVGDFSTEPFYTGINSYDAVKLLANVSSNIKSFNSNKTVAALENFNQTSPFLGASANIAFKNSHDLVRGDSYAFSLFCQWQLDGEKVVVPSFDSIYPDSLATGTFSIPYWGINNLVAAQDIPDSFVISSDADIPDKDGSFDLIWSTADGVDNYSIFMYDRNIQYISKRYLLNSYEGISSSTTSYPISGLKTGKFYFIIAAYNKTGERLSNTIIVDVDRRPGIFLLSSNAASPVDFDGTFNLTWSVSEGADNYSVYTYDSNITEINSSLTLIENQTALSPFLISKLKTGEYYFAIQALNATGERLSNNIYVNIDSSPKNFTLYSDVDDPVDTDGTFNLIWSTSAGADNYSIYTYESLITEINSSVTLTENQTAISPFLIPGLLDGDYFYAVMAYNETGEKLSNSIHIKVRYPPGQFILSSDAELPDDDGNFNLTWTNSARATSYSIFQYSEYITVINDSLTLIGTVQATNSSFEITGLDIGFYYYIVQAYNGYNHTESNCIDVNIQFYDEATGYWEVAPFVIDETGNGHYNWSEVVSLPWCSGSGTFGDPYIIEFIKIDGKYAGSCIIISESNVSFIIKNSSFNNAYNNEDDAAGIQLIHVSNGGLVYLNCSSNNAYGIFLESCQNINITSCSVNYNSLSGISLLNCTNISIINNTDTISYNDIDGIHLVGSDNNTIIRNTINNNLNGIFLDETSDNNYIDWNTLLGNGEAIFDLGQNNYVGDNNIFPSGGNGFPFDILLIVLIVGVAIVGVVGAAIIVKKRISISEKKEKVISEKKKEKIRRKLEEKLLLVDQLIKERQIKLAYKNLGKIKDTADEYDFFAIFNQANKKVEICKDIEAGIYREVKREEPVMSVATEKAKEEKETIPVIEKRKEFKVFLSYSSIDSDRFQIDKIANYLEKFPEIKKVYYYTKDSGQNIVEYMEKTLTDCNIFALFCSESSKKSKAVEGEWQAAYQMTKKERLKIIPIYENEDDIPFLLGPMLNVKFDKANLKSFIEKLYQEILR